MQSNENACEQLPEFLQGIFNNIELNSAIFPLNVVRCPLLARICPGGYRDGYHGRNGDCFSGDDEAAVRQWVPAGFRLSNLVGANYRNADLFDTRRCKLYCWL